MFPERKGLMGYFRKPVDPKVRLQVMRANDFMILACYLQMFVDLQDVTDLLQELVRKWQADIRAQQRALDRQIRDIERDRKAAEKQVKDAAKRGDISSAKTLAKEIVHTKKVGLRTQSSAIVKINLISEGP